nr:tetratricopeptide repeat protein [candidate division Zixibacteria bacterium]
MKQDAKQLLDLAKGWMKQGNTTVVFQLLRDALKLNEADQDRMVGAMISKELGRAFMQTGQWDRADDAFRQAATIYLYEADYRGAAESIRNLANMKFQMGQFGDCELLCDQAVDLATKSGDFQLRATILNTQGALASIQGMQKESIKIFNLCLSDFRKAGNRLRQAYALHNIGLAYLELGQFPETKKAFEEAMTMALENNDTNLVEICYQNMAKLQLKTGDIVAARSLISAAEELLDTLKSPQLAADLAIIKAMVYRQSGDQRQARTIIDRALKLTRSNNLLQHEAELLYELGCLEIETGEASAARSSLEAAITLLKKTGGNQLKKAVEKLKSLEASAKNMIRAA